MKRYKLTIHYSDVFSNFEHVFDNYDSAVRYAIQEIGWAAGQWRESDTERGLLFEYVSDRGHAGIEVSA